MDWYQLVYRASYLLGFTPWDRGVAASGLVELVEGPKRLPPGNAIELGCGSATNAIYLAQHGWKVTGVDMISSGLKAAQRNAARAGTALTLVQGDVTHLPDLGVGKDFSLLVDVGCFHTLPSRLRDAYVEAIAAIAAPGATLFLFAFSPRRLAPIQAGTTPEEVKARFKGWELVSATPAPDGTWQREMARVRLAGAIRYFAPWQYLLKRTSQVEA